MTWYLRFRSPTSTPFTAVDSALRAALGPLDVKTDAWTGNARDGYARRWTCTARDAARGLDAVTSFTENSRTGEGEEGPDTTVLSIELPRGDLRARKAAWAALAASLFPLGYVDDTLLAAPRAILVDLEAAGLSDEAAALRAAVTQALVRTVPKDRSVILSWTCPDDVDAVLAAYLWPLDISTLSFSRTGLTALPQGAARFPRARSLHLDEPGLDAATLAGWSFPSLDLLSLTGSGTRRLMADAVRGMPALRTIMLADTPLEEIDPAVRDVCPALARILVARTPLAADPSRFAALARALGGVRLDR